MISTISQYELVLATSSMVKDLSYYSLYNSWRIKHPKVMRLKTMCSLCDTGERFEDMIYMGRCESERSRFVADISNL